MGMTVGNHLLSKIVEEQRLSDFSNLKKDWFIQDEIKTYEFILNHITKYGQLPSLDLLSKQSNVEKSSSDPLGYFYDEVTNRNIYNQFDNLFPKLQKHLSKRNSKKAVNELREFMFNIEKLSLDSGNEVTTMAQLGRQLLDRVRKNRVTDGLVGVPTGWEFLDKETNGFQGGRLYLFAGRPKLGKSMVLSRSSKICHEASHVPMVFSMEMEDLLWATRFFADKVSLNMRSLSSGKLPTIAEEMLEEAINIMEAGLPYYFISGRFRKDLNAIRALVNSIKPSAVYIDGGYLVKIAGSERMARWERMTDVAEGLAELSIQTNLPFIVTFQFTKEVDKLVGLKKRVELGNLQLADAIAQVASLVVGIFEDENEETSYQSTRRRLEIIGGRELERGGEAYINWDFKTMNFDEVHEEIWSPEREETNDNE